MTKEDAHVYYWDYENRLTKVELAADSSDVATYAYDALHRRVEKVDKTGESDVTTRYVYDDWRVIEERDGDGTLQAEYVNAPRMDRYVTMERDGATYWYMQSALVGNVAALVDSSGAVQEGVKYTAYGEATFLTGPGAEVADTRFHDHGASRSKDPSMPIARATRIFRCQPRRPGQP